MNAENKALKEAVKQKDADITGLVAHVVGEYKMATLKARYELLKEYKQGLLIDTDVEEEIELYEEATAEARAPTSTPCKNIEQLTTAVPSTVDEIRPVTVKPSTTDRSIGEPRESEKVVKQ